MKVYDLSPCGPAILAHFRRQQVILQSLWRALRDFADSGNKFTIVAVSSGPGIGEAHRPDRRGDGGAALRPAWRGAGDQAREDHAYESDALQVFLARYPECAAQCHRSEHS